MPARNTVTAPPPPPPPPPHPQPPLTHAHTHARAHPPRQVLGVFVLTASIIAPRRPKKNLAKSLQHFFSAFYLRTCGLDGTDAGSTRLLSVEYLPRVHLPHGYMYGTGNPQLLLFQIKNCIKSARSIFFQVYVPQVNGFCLKGTTLNNTTRADTVVTLHTLPFHQVGIEPRPALFGSTLATGP